MSAHTPGPWWPNTNSVGSWEVRTRRDVDEADPRADYGTDYGAYVCTGIGDHTEKRTRGNEEANARLIAAAPDLLEALEDLIGNYKENKGAGLGIGPIMKAKTAIAKAKGETP